MLTSRGWWLLLTVLSLLFLGLGVGRAPLVLISLTLLGWVLGSWLIFAVQCRWVEGKLRVEREVRNDRGPVRSLWAGQKFEIVARLVCDSGVSLPWVWIADRVPLLGRWVTGSNQGQGRLSRDEPVDLSYELQCPAAGRLRFDGLRVQAADVHGFFQKIMFVRQLTVYRVYPALADSKGYSPSVKRHNILPILGTHRHRRPGSGSELLDLRDYRPGDPPKMIAWKASARRDRLMTKEFESEVPVRCTLFVDVSSSVRVGKAGENVLARLVEIAAAVVQASAAVKDLTGLCLFEEQKLLKFIRPARGASHVHRLLGELADVADLPLQTEHAALDRLLPLAYALAQEINPDLLESDVNAFPIWLPWWSPQPAYTRDAPLEPRPEPGVGVSGWLRRQWRTFTNRRRWLLYNLLVGIHRRLSPHERRKYRWRKQLAAILSVRHRLGPGGLARILEDDAVCRRHLQRFLAEHQVAFPVPLYDLQGRYLLAAPEKVDVLVRALLASLSRGRDNELFVLLVDLLDVGSHLQKLLRAVQTARARHHRVLIIVPWPEISGEWGVKSGEKNTPAAVGSLQDLFFQASAGQMRLSAQVVQRAFARMGVPVLFSPQEEAVSLILHHMQQLRTLQRGGPA